MPSEFGTLSSYISNDDMVLCRLPDNGYSYYTLNPVDCSATERFRYDVGKKYTFSPSDVGDDERITSYLESHPGEFVIAQETLLNAQLSEATNMYNGARAVIALYIALGGGSR